MSRVRMLLGLGTAAAAGGVLVSSRRNAAKRVPSFPSGPVSLPADEAAAFAARMAAAPIVRKRDVAVSFAPSHSTQPSVWGPLSLHHFRSGPPFLRSG